MELRRRSNTETRLEMFGPVPSASKVETTLDHASGYKKPFELNRTLCPDHSDHRASSTMSSAVYPSDETAKHDVASVTTGQHTGSTQSDGRKTSHHSSLPHQQCRGMVSGDAAYYEPMETNWDDAKRQHPDEAFLQRMKNEAERLNTFHDFPKKMIIRPEVLSAAGLFFTGSGDKVQCAFCRGELEGWNPNDQPIADHRQYFPDCPFVNGRNVGNVPRSFFLEGNAGPTSSFLQPGHVSLGGENFHKEAKRLETFLTFPKNNPMQPEKLAEAGFYYLGDGDKTKCAFCKGILHNWEIGDDPLTEHRKRFPNCGFAHGLSVGNIPISTTHAHSSGGSSQQTFTCPCQLPQDWEQYPAFADQMSRINSFDDETWRRHEVINGVRIAVAGFFYTGRADVVQCFQCGGKLRKWEPLDEPWEEHAYHFPDCSFVRREKGEGFIRDVQRRRPKPNKPPQAKTPSSSTTAASTPGSVVVPFANLMISQPNQGSACLAAPTQTYTFLPKEIKARMDTPTVQLVLSKGYAYNDIRRLIEEKLRTTGDDFEGPKSLMQAILSKGIEPETQPILNFNEPMEQTSSAMQTNNEAMMVNQVAVSVNTFMSSEIARIAINMGYSSDAVKNIFEEKYAVTGSGFTSVEELIEALNGTSGEQQPFEEPQGATGTQQTYQSPMQVPEPQEMLVSPPSPGSLSEEEMTKLLEKQTLEYQRLSKENTQMKEAKICKICLDEEAKVVFLPCGHLVCCPNCAPSLRKCPICRTWIKGTVKVFQS